MPTPITRLTVAQLQTLASTTIGNAKPYQLDQVIDALNRVKFVRGSQSDVSGQPTITTILATMGGTTP